MRSAVVDVTVRRERRRISAGETPARKLVRSTAAPIPNHGGLGITNGETTCQDESKANPVWSQHPRH